MSTFEFGCHVFVDESKSKGYVVAAAAASPNDTSRIERELRKLTRRGQSRIHFTSESDQSRRTLLTQMSALDVRAQLYVVRGYSDKAARSMCLEALVTELADAGAARLVLERDDSLIAADRRIIRAALAERGYLERLRYHHAAPSEHPILWVSDAVAWCYQAGGNWIARTSGIVSGVTVLG